MKRREMTHSAMFTSAGDARAYALAGHATLTMSSLKTGARYTFKISRARNRETGELKDAWFVALLSGPDNEGDYQYVGLLNGTFQLTARSKFTPDSVPVRAFQFFWKHVSAGQMPPQMEVRHEGSCGRCGRKLTVPESIDRGIGPECASKMGG